MSSPRNSPRNSTRGSPRGSPRSPHSPRCSPGATRNLFTAPIINDTNCGKPPSIKIQSAESKLSMSLMREIGTTLFSVPHPLGVILPAPEGPPSVKNIRANHKRSMTLMREIGTTLISVPHPLGVILPAQIEPPKIKDVKRKALKTHRENERTQQRDQIKYLFDQIFTIADAQMVNLQNAALLAEEQVSVINELNMLISTPRGRKLTY